MADESSEKKKQNYKEALEAADELLNRQKEINDSTQVANDLWNDISNYLFRLSGSDWFKQVPKTTQELRESAQQVKKMKDNISAASADINDKLGSSLSGVKEQLKNISTTDLTSGASGLAAGLNKNSKQAQELKQLFGKIDNNFTNINQLSEKEFLDNLKNIKDNFEQYKDDVQKVDEEFLNNLIEKSEQFLQNNKNLNEKLKEAGGKLESIANIQDQTLKTELLRAAKNEDIAGFVQKYGQRAQQALATTDLLSNEELKVTQALSKQVEQASQFEQQMQETNKTVLDLGGAIQKIGSELQSALIDHMLDYDQAIAEAQRRSNVMFRENTEQMKELTVQTAEFGMTIQETTEFMTGLASELKTTDFDVLSKAASDLSAIRMATGASLESIQGIAGEMMFFGSSSERVKQAFTDAHHQANMLGLSTKNVIEQIDGNLEKMRQFGFEEGVESLKNMAVEAENLRYQVDEIFNVVEQTRNIQGAMETAAQMQLAGGSFANVNPMQLLSAARESPQKLQDMLKQMGKDIGEFNEETGQIKFDPVDVDRLKMVADATNMSLDSLQNMIGGTRKQMMKLSDVSKDAIQGAASQLDEVDASMAKSMLGDMIKYDQEKKEFKVKADSLLAEKGIEDLSNLTQKEIQTIIEEKKDRQQTMEQLATQRKSLRESWNNLITSFMNTLTVLEPIVSTLAETVSTLNRWFSKAPDWVKTVTSTILGLTAAIPILSNSFKMFRSTVLGPFRGAVAGIKGAFQEGLNFFRSGATRRRVIDKAKQAAGGGSIGNKMTDQTKKMANSKANSRRGASIGGFFKGIAAGIRSFGGIRMTDLLKFSASLTIIGGALVGFSAAMTKFGGEPSIQQMVGVASSLVMLGGSMVLLAKISKGINTGGLLKMSASMAIVGSALIPFAHAAKMMKEIDFSSVLKSISMMGLVIAGLTGLGTIMMGPQLAALATGVGILVGVSASLAAVSGSLILAASAFNKVSQIDWEGFSQMGPALMNVVPGLAAFSTAVLGFANPATIFAIGMMTAQLGGLVSVMSPLADNFHSAADGVDRFSQNLNKLQKVSANLKTGKLEKLSSISQEMATSNVLSGIGKAIGNFVGGEEKSKSETKEVRHVVELRWPNGRKIKEVVLNDTDQQS